MLQFDELYRDHAPDVYRYTLAVLRNPADAEDATQTTFLNAYRAIRRGQEPERKRNWLIAIAHNVCRARFRDAGRRPEEVPLAGDVGAGEAEGISAGEIRTALSQLAKNQRAALVLRELEGRTYEEIAGSLGLTVSAVETLLFRARRALREQLEPGLTCEQAMAAVGGLVPRSERGPLRAHLRACPECAKAARKLRARRLLKGLGWLPFPLPALVAGGGGAAIATGIAAKAAGFSAVGLLVTGAAATPAPKSTPQVRPKPGISDVVRSTPISRKHRVRRPFLSPVAVPAQRERHHARPHPPRRHPAHEHLARNHSEPLASRRAEPRKERHGHHQQAERDHRLGNAGDRQARGQEAGKPHHGDGHGRGNE